MPEKFNPTNFESYEDMQEEEKTENFKKVDNGFVRKEVLNLEEARERAEKMSASAEATADKQEKIASGEANDYNEAEKMADSEKQKDKKTKFLVSVGNRIKSIPITLEDTQKISKEEIIKRIKAKEIYPQKPNLKECFAWALKTKFGLTYDTSEGAKAYDKFARYYFGRERMANDIALTFLENMSTNPNDALICERAAGTGIITEVLINAGYKVRASDLSKEQLNMIAQRFPNIETILEDFNGPMQGVKDESVDGIVEVAAGRYMTIDGQKNYVKEAHRTLKKDGVLLWSIFPGEFIYKLKYGFKWRAGEKQITELLENYGFEIVSNKRYFYGLNTSKIFRLLVAKKLQKL